MTRSTVFLSITLLQFLKRISEKHKTPTTIVICSTREEFIHNLNIAVARAQESSNNADKEASRDFFSPSLMFLAGAQSVTLAFCPSLSSLHAYLSVYQAKAQNCCEGVNSDSFDNSECLPTLALLNPISLFSDDSSRFSAHSVGKFFASAYEAAARAKQDLIVAECRPSNLMSKIESDASHLKHTIDPERSGDASMADPEEVDMTEQEIGNGFPDKERGLTDNLLEPWTQLIPISDSNSKRFGSAQRRWLERSITVQTVAKRWCEFRDMAN